jgi:nitroreductase
MDTVPVTGAGSAWLLDRMRRRRVTREFSDEPVAESVIRSILAAGRWASSGGNLHIHKFVVVDDPRLVELVKASAPGIIGNPACLIVICTDLERCRQVGMRPTHVDARYIDVGTAAMNMLLMAQEEQVGACPVTSFSKRGVAAVLELPNTLIPELMVILGHPRPAPRQLRTGTLTRLSVEDLTLVARFDGAPRRLAPTARASGE